MNRRNLIRRLFGFTRKSLRRLRGGVFVTAVVALALVIFVLSQMLIARVF